MKKPINAHKGKLKIKPVKAKQKSNGLFKA
jgi:hypothetical protein